MGSTKKLVVFVTVPMIFKPYTEMNNYPLQKLPLTMLAIPKPLDVLSRTPPRKRKVPPELLALTRKVTYTKRNDIYH